jgi:hypothetical protein
LLSDPSLHATCLPRRQTLRENRCAGRYLVSPSLARRIAVTTHDRGKLLRLGRYLTRCPILNLRKLKLPLRQIPEIRPAPARRLADHLTDPLFGILVEQHQPALARGPRVGCCRHTKTVSNGSARSHRPTGLWSWWWRTGLGWLRWSRIWSPRWWPHQRALLISSFRACPKKPRPPFGALF